MLCNLKLHGALSFLLHQNHSAKDVHHVDTPHGKVLVAGFVEGHLHLEKANVMQRKANRSGTLKEAIAVTAELKPTLTREVIRERSIQVLRALVQAGTTHVRAHAEFDPPKASPGSKWCWSCASNSAR
ncbi:hypothetical protein PPUJ20066_49880 [Pseudomonas putida]|nr:hypothetical protein PPUJ20066_49880 [Pseudomonas putida]